MDNANASSVKKETLCRQVAGKIRTAMRRGEWGPGETLPSMDELAQKHGAHRNTVSSAMQILQNENLVVSRPRVGTTVAENFSWKRAALLFPDTEFGHWQIIYKEIEYFMKSKGWTFDLLTHHGQLELMQQHLRTIADGDYAGMIFGLPHALLRQDDELFGELLSSGFPMLSIGGGLNCWMVDDLLYECGYWGAKYLIDQNYKWIAFVGRRSYNGEVFVDGCKRALEEANLDDFGIGYAEDVEFALKILDNWLALEKRPDAIFYQHSVHSRHCFQTMQAKGIEIGPEIGFMALDDSTFHRITVPGPCVIRRHPEMLGQKAVELFLELAALSRKERIQQIEKCDPKRYETEISIVPGRSACGRRRRMRLG
jgi:DNA-binding LacI/PurR family transcriptional regulator